MKQRRQLTCLVVRLGVAATVTSLIMRLLRRLEDKQQSCAS
jgi:hypothetical protein